MTSILVRCLAFSACLLAVACGSSDTPVDLTAKPTPAAIAVRRTVGVGNSPVNVLADPPRGRAYVLNLVGESIMVLDGFAGTVIATLEPLKGPTDIAIDLDLRRMYVVSERERRIIAIDLNSFETVSSRVLSRLRAAKVSVDTVTHQVYVSHPDLAVVTLLDGATLVELTIFPVESGPSRVAVDPVTHRANVTRLDGGAVDVVDGDRVVETVPVGPGPDGIVMDAATRTAFVSVTGASSVVAIDATDTVTGTLAVGNRPGLPAIDAAARTLYVPNAGDNTLSVISLDTRQTLQVLPVGRHPAAAAVDTSAHRVYVANRDENSVSIVTGAQ